MANQTIQSILAMPNPAFFFDPIPARRRERYEVTWIDPERLNIRRWDEFNINTLSSALGDLLQQPASPARVEAAPANRRINNVSEMKSHCMDSLVRILNVPMAAGGSLLGHQLGFEVLVDHMRDVAIPEAAYKYEPSLVFYIDNNPRVYLAVSCVRVSPNWTSEALQNGELGAINPICHLGAYARETGTRYGFVMTDIEVVVVRFTVDPNGEYGAEWQAIPRSASGEGTLTVGLAVWSLTMMALNGQHRALATKAETLPINLWWEEQDARGARVYRHHLSGRQLPYLHYGGISSARQF